VHLKDAPILVTLTEIVAQPCVIIGTIADAWTFIGHLFPIIVDNTVPIAIVDGG
jgi:hypothetical protein